LVCPLADVIMVGLAELKVADNPCVLASFGLGSCVAVAMVDPVRKKGGLAHVMLPESRGRDSDLTPGKFADTAVARLVAELTAVGARPANLRCKISGGAEMFVALGSSSRAAGGGVSTARIGARNVEGVKAALREAGIPLTGEDTGGSHGRTVRFDTATGEVEVTSISGLRKVI